MTVPVFLSPSQSSNESGILERQVYAASIMFGYFVRRVDKRFQLERSLGMLPQNTEEAVARLERLFSQVCAHLPCGLLCMLGGLASLRKKEKEGPALHD